MNNRDRFGRTRLHYLAAQNDTIQMVQLLNEGSNPNAADRKGATPLHFAAQEYSLEAAEVLIVHGATVDAIDKYGNTPLSDAVFNARGRGEMIQLLRAHGADATKKNLHDQSPLGLARLIGNYNVRQFFSDLP
jgi:ankyrin repeat protein